MGWWKAMRHWIFNEDQMSSTYRRVSFLCSNTHLFAEKRKIHSLFRFVLVLRQIIDRSETVRCGLATERVDLGAEQQQHPLRELRHEMVQHLLGPLPHVLRVTAPAPSPRDWTIRYIVHRASACHYRTSHPTLSRLTRLRVRMRSRLDRRRGIGWMRGVGRQVAAL